MHTRRSYGDLGEKTMSNATEEELENLSDEELEKQALAEAEAKQAKAAPKETEPDPELEDTASPASTPENQEPPVTPSPSPEPINDRPQDKDKDPMEWARAKGFKSPEDMARALLQKEQEFHQSRQKKEQETPPPPPNWNPQPQYGFGYPPIPPQPNLRQVAARYPQIDPEDFEKLAPIMADIAKAAARQERMQIEAEVSDIRRSTARQNELMTLMQDPAFRDERVQKEIHAVLDSDPTIFQRERSPHVYAFHQAMTNLARKQLQQDTTPRNGVQKGMNPPFTAGGGNGSANTGPIQVTEKMFSSWTEKEQKAFLETGKPPRR